MLISKPRYKGKMANLNWLIYPIKELVAKLKDIAAKINNGNY